MWTSCIKLKSLMEGFTGYAEKNSQCLALHREFYTFTVDVMLQEDELEPITTKVIQLLIGKFVTRALLALFYMGSITILHLNATYQWKTEGKLTCTTSHTAYSFDNFPFIYFGAITCITRFCCGWLHSVCAKAI